MKGERKERKEKVKYILSAPFVANASIPRSLGTLSCCSYYSRKRERAVEDARNIYDIFCSARLQIEIYDRPENGRRE